MMNIIEGSDSEMNCYRLRNFKECTVKYKALSIRFTLICSLRSINHRWAMLKRILLTYLKTKFLSRMLLKLALVLPTLCREGVWMLSFATSSKITVKAA